ncbi:MAG: acyl-CoA dehydrogenase family protein [Acidimicrobiales bacterium]|nr:acyl-CoA dehydrogenase family protein [Acidimicrobiales bacterium]
MDLQPSPDEALLAESARKSFLRDCPMSLVRELLGPESVGHSPDLWTKMAEQGWLGLGLPEAHGGAGSLLDLGLVVEESGRALVPSTFRSTMQAALLVAGLGNEEQQSELVGRISSGLAVSAVAYTEPQAIHDPRYLTTRAVPGDDGWVLSGVKSFVANAHLADPLLVVARTTAGAPERALTVFCVPAGTDGVTLEPQATFAHDRQFRVLLDGVGVGDGAVLGGPAAIGRALPAVIDARQRWVALLCAEMVGGAQKVLELTSEYVIGRVQFGKPIGSFQAVQHHVANMAMGVEGSRLATYQALWRLANDRPAAKSVAIAKAWTGEAYKGATVMAHQLFGGMGYVRENDLHLWSEHAKASELALGPRDHQLLKVASELGL